MPTELHADVCVELSMLFIAQDTAKSSTVQLRGQLVVTPHEPAADVHSSVLCITLGNQEQQLHSLKGCICMLEAALPVVKPDTLDRYLH